MRGMVLWCGFILFIIYPRLTFSFWFCGNKCKDEISRGPICLQESVVPACLRKHHCDKLSKQYEVFEENVCQSSLLTEFEAKPECWGEMFHKCHQVAVISTLSEREKSCRGKPSIAFFCYHIPQSNLSLCRVPIQRFLNTILFRQQCLNNTHMDTRRIYHGCYHYCEGDILAGPQCNGKKSEGVKCLSGCEDPFLQKQAQHLSIFEETVCQIDLSNEVYFRPCWLELFTHCKDIAVHRVNGTYEFCQKQRLLLTSCQERIKALFPPCEAMARRILKHLLSSVQDNICQAMLSSCESYHKSLLFIYIFWLLLTVLR